MISGGGQFRGGRIQRRVQDVRGGGVGHLGGFGIPEGVGYREESEYWGVKIQRGDLNTRSGTEAETHYLRGFRSGPGPRVGTPRKR